MIASTTKVQLWRFGAIALFCALPLLAIAGIVSNTLDATEAADLAARKRTTTALILTQLERHRAHDMTPLDAAALYLTSTSDSLARAEIQERATRLVTQSGGRLAEVQLTTTPEQETAGTVAIQVSLDIDNKGLLDLLYAVESGLPLLDVTDLSAQRVNDQTEGDDAGAGALRVEMTLRAHWRKGTG